MRQVKFIVAPYALLEKRYEMWREGNPEARIKSVQMSMGQMEMACVAVVYDDRR